MEERMARIYALAFDEHRCKQAMVRRTPIRVIGLSDDGKVQAVDGVIDMIEKGHAVPGYPIRITIRERRASDRQSFRLPTKTRQAR